MSEEGSSRVDREGIHIARDLAEAVAIDEELDANVVGPYRFPHPSRRRLSAWVFLAAAPIVGVAVDGGWMPALGLVALAGWNLVAAWPLRVDEGQALALAAGAVDFAVGHASAAITFHGWRSRPRWSVVLYSAEEPPERRALVVVDAVDGLTVGDPYVEVLSGE